MAVPVVAGKTEEAITLLPKEEARKQFEQITQQLGLVHTFTFDEVYDTLLERRLARRDNFRSGIIALEEHIKTVPGSLGEDPFPLVHTFAGGLYIRHLEVPAQTLTVTKIHKQEHAFFLMKGTISILTEEGIKKFTAPYHGITKVGTKRIIWHHDDVIFCTVHATNETTIEKAEEQIVAKDFGEIDNLEERAKIKDFIDVASKEA